MKEYIESSRRKFLMQLGILTAIPLLGSGKILPAAKIKFGYSTITWGNDIERAIKEIASLGFTGVQLRNPFAAYGSKPEVLKQLLSAANLEVVMLSSGNANINTGNDESEITKHVENAKFIKKLGGKRIQITNSSRPKTGDVKEEDLIRFGKLLTEIGSRTAEFDIETTYHNHMEQLGETPEEVDIILQHADPKYVGFLLDIAHYFQGGGDPAAAVLKYKDRIKMLHLKDVISKEGGNGYQFVELGQGSVDIPAVFKALNTINFKGYAVVELDAVPVKGRTQLASGQISKDYLDTLGYNI
ncbi:sugar phosphate isomerase/epimerase family protein [Olivibacter domesticus]|uniref:Inosose dehydratase n=1 Tax=Olivibacter domesticus TaxID=407022 RepID=A0A1H7W445_OLID1|nr:sugar phosphate isomerase/epimerase [Olivibacter domesticus]SEM15869.1 inosose dehydratase [Olivibacter domesticus]